MSVEITASSGNIVAGSIDMIWKPQTIRGSGKYGVVMIHGANGIDAFTKTVNPKSNILGSKLAAAGIPCVATTAGSTAVADQWLNDTSMGYITTLKTYLAAQTGCSSAKVIIIGASMGAGTAIRYASLNPGNVAGVTGIIPLSNLQYHYNNNNPSSSSASDQIMTAWGLSKRTVADVVLNSTTTITSATAAFVAGDIGGPVFATGVTVGTTIASVTNGTTALLSAAATATASSVSTTFYKPLPMTGSPSANLVTLAAGLNATVPVQLFYSGVDTIVRPADVTALATAMGITATNVDTSFFGHADGTIGEVDLTALVAWCKTNGA